MILIVFSHSIPKMNSTPYLMNQIASHIQLIGLPVFMSVSGYLLVKTNAIEKYGYPIFLRSRFVRLMIPFFSIQLIMIFPKYIISLYSNSNVEISFTATIMAFINPRTFGILPHLWFLPTLMVISVISSLILWVLKNKIFSAVLLVFTLILASIPSITNLFYLNDIKNYLFWFVLGAICAKYKFDQIIKHRFMILIFSSVSYFLIMLFPQESSILRLLSSFMGLLIILMLSQLLEKPFFRPNEYLCDKTFAIYILSLPAQNIFEIIGIKTGIPWAITMTGMFVTGLFVPLIIVKIVVFFEKKIPVRIFSTIIGMQSK